jgi:Tfp pilus assembly protein PilX
MRNINGSSRRRSRGIALAAALITLVVVALIGIAAFSANFAETKVTAANNDYSRALLAADSAVQQGESFVYQNRTDLPAPTSGSSSSTFVPIWDSSGISASGGGGVSPNGNAPAIADLFKFDWTNKAFDFKKVYDAQGDATGTRNDAQLARVPDAQYVIEYLGTDDTSAIDIRPGPTATRHYFRVTGHASGNNPNVAAMTQSVYATVY